MIISFPHFKPTKLSTVQLLIDIFTQCQAYTIFTSWFNSLCILRFNRILSVDQNNEINQKTFLANVAANANQQKAA